MKSLELMRETLSRGLYIWIAHLSWFAVYVIFLIVAVVHPIMPLFHDLNLIPVGRQLSISHP